MTQLTTEREARFRGLFSDAYLDVLRFAERRVDATHAEDVVAEAFLVTWRRLDDVPARRDDARAWLFGIARNCILNARRGQGRQEAVSVRLADASVADGVVQGLDADLVATRVDVAAAWRTLSAADQEVLALTVLEDLTSPQAARVLAITAPAYRLRLHRARHALRTQLDIPRTPALSPRREVKAPS